jgi:hypothetical protein
MERKYEDIKNEKCYWLAASRAEMAKRDIKILEGWH